MTVDSVERRGPNRYVTAPKSGTLAEVIDLILDKGLVIDVFVRVSLVGIEILRVDARVVVASVDTYLRFAEAAGRLDLDQRRDPGLPDLVDRVGSAAKGGAVSGIASGIARGIARGAAGALSGAVSGDRDKAEQRDKVEQDKRSERE
jgi:hypothetical protein